MFNIEKNRKKINPDLIKKKREGDNIEEIKTVKKEEPTPKKESVPEDDFFELYAEDDQAKVRDLTKIEKASRKGRVAFLVLLILFLSIALIFSFLSWFIFTDDDVFKGDNIIIDVKTSEEVISGDEIVYVLKYSNLESIGIKDVQLNVRYPNGFIFETAVPEPQAGDNIWKFEQLDSNQHGNITIKGKLLGETASAKTLTAVLDYTPLNFNSSFQSVGSYTTTISDVPLVLALTGPESVLVGEEVEYLFEYENDLENNITLDQLKLTLNVPENFIITDSEPKLRGYENENYWLLNDVLGKGEVKFKGNFNSIASELQDIIVKASLVSQGNTYYQTEYQLSVAVKKSDLDISLIINGDYQGGNLAFGDSLYYGIILKNTTQALMEGISLSLQVDLLQNKELNTNESVVNVVDWDRTQLTLGAELINYNKLVVLNLH